MVRLLYKLVSIINRVYASKTTSIYTSILKKHETNHKVNKFLKENDDTSFIEALDETLEIKEPDFDYFEMKF